MSILGVQDWDALGRQFVSASPFPSICIDNFLDAEFAAELASSYPGFNDVRNLGREFKSVNENLKVQVTDPEKFPVAVTRLCDMLSSQDFLDKISSLSGIDGLKWDPSFTGGGMHVTGPTGILDVHVDFNFEKRLDMYRRLNLLIYLNPQWEKTWGGEVELWDKDVKNCIHSFAPVFNRCVIFATSDYSYHGVTQVKTPEGITRNSFAVYYYSGEPGENAGTGLGGHHSTIFKARPDELTKKFFSMPAEKLMRKGRKFIRNIKTSLKS